MKAWWRHQKWRHLNPPHKRKNPDNNFCTFIPSIRPTKSFKTTMGDHSIINKMLVFNLKHQSIYVEFASINLHAMISIYEIINQFISYPCTKFSFFFVSSPHNWGQWNKHRGPKLHGLNFSDIDKYFSDIIINTYQKEW